MQMLAREKPVKEQGASEDFQEFNEDYEQINEAFQEEGDFESEQKE